MPIMLLQWQPVLGMGTSHHFDRDGDLFEAPQLLNLIGHPEATRFLAFAALKESYQDDDELLPAAMEIIGRDMREAFQDGIELGQTRIRLAPLSVKGDWPFLIEAGSLQRHFRRAPKAAASSCVQVGVCHRCLAGTVGFPFSDCGDSPRFLATVGSAAAATWCSEVSPFTEYLLKVVGKEEELGSIIKPLTIY